MIKIKSNSNKIILRSKLISHNSFIYIFGINHIFFIEKIVLESDKNYYE